MINLELSKDLNPFLIYDDVRKRHTLSILNGTLTFKTNIPETKRYMLCMKYNIYCVALYIYIYYTR